MTHICILGTGLGGIPMALEMRERARPEDRVTVIDNADKCTFTKNRHEDARHRQAQGIGGLKPAGHFHRYETGGQH